MDPAQMARPGGTNFAIGMCIAMAFWLIMGRVLGEKRSRYGHPGSMDDLVRRGQLRSDRRGMSDIPNPLSLPCLLGGFYLASGLLLYGFEGRCHMAFFFLFSTLTHY